MHRLSRAVADASLARMPALMGQCRRRLESGLSGVREPSDVSWADSAVSIVWLVSIDSSSIGSAGFCFLFSLPVIEAERFMFDSF